MPADSPGAWRANVPVSRHHSRVAHARLVRTLALHACGLAGRLEGERPREPRTAMSGVPTLMSRLASQRDNVQAVAVARKEGSGLCGGGAAHAGVGLECI